jgi:hypothetical protein
MIVITKKIGTYVPMGNLGLSPRNNHVLKEKEN